MDQNEQQNAEAAAAEAAATTSTAESTVPVTVEPVESKPGFFKAMVGEVQKFFQKVGDELKEVSADVVDAVQKTEAAVSQAARKAVDAVEAPVVNERNEMFQTKLKALQAKGLQLSISFPNNGHEAHVEAKDKKGQLVAAADGHDLLNAVEALEDQLG